MIEARETKKDWGFLKHYPWYYNPFCNGRINMKTGEIQTGEKIKTVNSNGKEEEFTLWTSAANKFKPNLGTIL